MRRSEIVKQMEGDKNSPEAQAAAALKQRSDEATVAGLEADVGVKRATAAKVQAEAQQGGDNGVADLQKKQAELNMLHEKTQVEMTAKLEELSLKGEEMKQSLALKAQEHEQNVQIKQNEAAQKQQMDLEDAIQKRHLAAKEAEAKAVEAAEPKESKSGDENV
jgi:hypothetical protein